MANREILVKIIGDAEGLTIKMINETGSGHALGVVVLDEAPRSAPGEPGPFKSASAFLSHARQERQPARPG